MNWSFYYREILYLKFALHRGDIGVCITLGRNTVQYGIYWRLISLQVSSLSSATNVKFVLL